MDSSLHNTNLTTEELTATHELHTENGHAADGEAHVHLPNPSLWPLILGVAILVVIVGLLFIPDDPWLSIVAAPFVLVGIIGWGLEDPNAPLKDRVFRVQPDPAGFVPEEDVVTTDGVLLGKIRGRFKRYILAQDNGLFAKAYYIPHSIVAKNIVQKNVVVLASTYQEVEERELTNVPDDLYEEAPEFGQPVVRGAPQFARGPLSPAETGHYNYGRNYPGINTDASGSYHREEINPHPQLYVGGRRRYATNKPVPSSEISSN